MTVVPLPLRPKVSKDRWERIAEGIYRRGSSIRLEIMVHGRRVRRRLGRVTLTEARRIAGEVRGELARRSAGLGAEPSPVTVERLLEARLEDRAMRVAPSTLVRMKEHVRRLLPHLGGIQARSLCAEDLRRYQLRRRNEGASPATINREVCLLGAAIRAAVHQGRLERDPLAGVEWRLPEPEAGSAARVLSREEVERIRAASAPWFGRFVAVAAAIGCRAGELATAQVEDVDLGHRRITFRAEETKGRRGRRRPREVHLPAEALGVVREAVEAARSVGSPYLFPAPRDTGRPIGTDGVSQAWRRAIRQACLPHARLHDLRHSFITRLVRRGVSPTIIRRIVGHASTQMIDQRYAHLAPDEVAAAALEADGGRGPSSAPSLL